MENKEAPPSIENQYNNQIIEKDEEIPDKNEIIIEQSNQVTNEKKDIKIEKPTEDTPNKNEIIIDNTNNPPLNKNEIKIEEQGNDIFTQFMKSYPEKLFTKFEFDFFGDTFEPDCSYLKDGLRYYIYFNIKKLRNKLERKWSEILEKYPKTISDLKQPLEEYMSNPEGTAFIEKSNFFQNIYIKIIFMFGEEIFNKEARERAKAIAYLLSQINCREKKELLREDFEVAKINSRTLKIDFEQFSLYEIIYKDIKEIKVRIDTLEDRIDSLNQLCEKYISMFKDIDQNYSADEENKLKPYLAYQINKQLINIENGDVFKDEENNKKMKSLRNKLNKVIILLNNEKDIDDSFLLGLKMNYYTIVKSTKNQQDIILNGVYMRQFYDKLEELFNNLWDSLIKFQDDNEEEIKPAEKKDFIRKLRKKADNLEQLVSETEKEINSLNSKTLKNGIKMIDNLADGVNNAKQKEYRKILQNGENLVDLKEQIDNNKIDKNLLDKKGKINTIKKENIIQLIIIFELIEKLKFIEDKRFYSDNFNGIYISKKINKTKIKLADMYSVSLI